MTTDDNSKGVKFRRGFTIMTPERRREIASMGGKAVHEKGTAHEFTVEEAREAGRKGGLVSSVGREHMAKIGRMGGLASSRDRERMSEMGRKGGTAPHAKRGKQQP